jgi:hypothetical protein
MPLVNCPECGRQVSTAAEACPQCGHPMKAATTNRPTGPKCYACAAAATTRCQHCGTLSCVEHLNHINYGLGPKVLCESCRTPHLARAIFLWIWAIVVCGGIVIAMLSFGHR